MFGVFKFVGWVALVRATLLLSAASYLCYQAYSARVVDIVVSGAHYASVDEILKVASSGGKGLNGELKGEAMWRVDLPGIRDTLIRTVPWIESVSVSRVFPHTIAIRAKEHIPVAVWRDKNGRTSVVNASGVKIVSGISEDKFKDLVILEGEKAATRVHEIGKLLDIDRRIAVATLVGNRRWNLRLRSGVEILLPEEGHVEAWSRAVEVVVANPSISRVDMRVAGRMYFS
jgi:cell division septal protein FtsQ